MRPGPCASAGWRRDWDGVPRRRGRGCQRPEKAATVNRDFAAYEEALQYFPRTTSVADARTHFADIAQGTLPFAEEEPIRRREWSY